MNQVVTQTLYRKYRPQTFEDVVGQSEVISTLKKQIENESIAHAYLFSGGRGTGKTSIARIFARELGTHEQDIYEIDAASNRGINEIRELRDGVANLPFYSIYKVYIIDEVHMLTKEAFNALLKTLEEPPKHVLFVLATTEKHKVLDTIISRCQVYDFKLGERHDLISLIQNVVEQEGGSIDDDSAQYIANLGSGSYRDTLSHLQKVLAVIGKKITTEALKEIYQATDTQTSSGLFEALAERDQDKLIREYQEFARLSGAKDYTSLIEYSIDTARKVLMLRYSKEYKEILKQEMTTEQVTHLESLEQVSSHTLRDLLELYDQLIKTSKPQELVELFIYEQIEKWNTSK